MSGVKVVGIHGHNPYQSTLAKALPDALVSLRELNKDRLQKLLRNLFDGADDALFAMADKASSNQEQVTYFDAMRELRIQKRHIATMTLKKVIESYNETGEGSGRHTPVSKESIDELSLVKNDELEINVALEGMVTRLRNVAGERLDALQARVECLLECGKLNAEHVPCSPEILCSGFIESCAELDLEIKAKLIFMKLFERFVLAGMVNVYDELNAALVQKGVLPNYKKEYAPVKQQSATPAPLDARAQGASSSTYNEQDTQNNFESLRQMLHSTDVNVPSTMSQQQANQHYFSHNELLSALSTFQASGSAAQSQLQAGTQLIDFHALFSQGTEKGTGSSAEACNAVDSDVINLVSMLFEFILEDRQLQPEMRALIARLQIPILKVAIIDRNFFNKGGHPARRLLNEIATAAVGWNPPKNDRRDRLKDKIEAIVDTILHDFQDDISMFDSLLADFVKFVDQDQRRGLLVEQRTKDSERGKAASELAKRDVQDFLNASMKGRPMPEFAVTLLRDAWSSVMVLHHLKAGTESDAWRSACSFVEELIWSLCPNPKESGARESLLKLIPSLVSRLREGLSEIAYDTLRTKALMKKLEDQHVLSLQALQQQVDLSNATRPAQDLSEQELSEAQDEVVADLVRATMELEDEFASAMREEPADEPAQDKQNSGQGASHHLPSEHVEPFETDHDEIVLVPPEKDEPAPTEILVDEHDPHVKQVDAFAVGCWFEFQDENDRTERCKLAAIIKASGKYIFVNRSGIKVAEKTRLGLATSLKKGSLQVLNDGLLFDRALESIITNLRG